MATYAELNQLAADNVLLDKITVAIIIAANAVLNELPATTNHANRLIWAKDAFINPASYAKPFLNAVIAANNGASTATILAASDATIQTNINATIDIFAGA